MTCESAFRVAGRGALWQSGEILLRGFSNVYVAALSMRKVRQADVL